MFKILTENIASFIAHFNNADKHVHESIRLAMEKVVKKIEADAKRNAPVKTGTLRRSITSRVEEGGKLGKVGTNLPYAPYQEYGTIYIEGKHYMENAYTANREYAITIFKNEAKKGLAKAGEGT